MKKLLLIFLFGAMWMTVGAKSLIFKAVANYKLDTSTNIESDKTTTITIIEFDPDEKEMIELTEEGKTYSVNIIRFKMSHEDNYAMVDFMCENGIRIRLMESLNSDYKAVIVGVDTNPVVLVYVNQLK